MRQTRLHNHTNRGSVDEPFITEQAKCDCCSVWTDLDELTTDYAGDVYCHHCKKKEPRCSICRIPFPCNCAKEIEVL